MTITTSGYSQVGEIGIIDGQVLVCADAGTSMMSDDGPQAWATWRQPTEAEMASPAYAQAARSVELTRRQEETWARNREAEKREVQQRMQETGEAVRAAVAYAKRPVRSDNLAIVTQEDEDLLNNLFA